MAKKKKQTAEIKINNDVKVVINIDAYRKKVDSKVADKEQEKFSLTECAAACGVDAPQLNYYYKQGIVKPIGDYEAGFKRYFDRNALLVFIIIKSLKESMRINIECLKPLQRLVK